jgi:hypothetical protein
VVGTPRHKVPVELNTNGGSLKGLKSLYIFVLADFEQQFNPAHAIASTVMRYS